MSTPPELLAERIRPVLDAARELGFLGPGPVDAHVDHAVPLVEVLAGAGLAVDLGSGGGVPGLVLALATTGTEWVLVESQQRRAAWLTEAARTLGLADRVRVVAERAELVGRSELRHRATWVTARSFGPPAVAAECGAPLLAGGGTLWVAEPPEPGAERWSAAGLTELGLDPEPRRIRGWVGFVSQAPTGERYPRRVGIPSKRPLF